MGTTPQIVASTIYSALSHCKVSDLQNYTKNVIILYNNTEPKEAIQILTKNNIRAAPVKDKNGAYIGVLDIRDTVDYTLQCLSTSKISSAFSLRTNEFCTVSAHDPLLRVLESLATGAHIVGVEDSDKQLIGIINQSILFQYVSIKWRNIGCDCLLQQMFDLKHISWPIQSVQYDMSAHDAFKRMSDLKMSGLAVVDDDGMLIHNTSATDLKLWRTESSKKQKNDHMLDQTIEEFLINIRKESKEMTRYPTTSCRLNETLHHAIKQLAATKYHRIWIVDDKKCPIGVLSLTDIFYFVSQSVRNK